MSSGVWGVRLPTEAARVRLNRRDRLPVYLPQSEKGIETCLERAHLPALERERVRDRVRTSVGRYRTFALFVLPSGCAH